MMVLSKVQGHRDDVVLKLISAFWATFLWTIPGWGVGRVCGCMFSRAQLFVTLSCSPASPLSMWLYPQNTKVGCHSLLRALPNPKIKPMSLKSLALSRFFHHWARESPGMWDESESILDTFKELRSRSFHSEFMGYEYTLNVPKSQHQCRSV